MRITRRRSGIVSKITIILIIMTIIVVVATIIFNHLSENHYFADKKFEELARSYYENSLYENFVKEHDGEDLSEAFSKYKNGFNIKLRQLLNYEFLEHNSNYRSYFDTDKFTCDTNTSHVIFKPHAPYGKKDYDAEFNLDCSN